MTQVGKKPLKTIGRHVMIDLPELGYTGIDAKIDTGAFRTVIHCESAKVIRDASGEEILEAVFDLDGNGPHVYRFEDFFRKDFKSSFGESESRFCIHTTICIGHKKIHSSVSLTDRSGMKFPVLIGRKTLLRKFLVDVSRKY